MDRRRLRVAALVVAVLANGLAYLATGSPLFAVATVGAGVAAMVTLVTIVRDARREPAEEDCGWCGCPFTPVPNDPTPGYCSAWCREQDAAEYAAWCREQDAREA
jgi:hypothetical protein